MNRGLVALGSLLAVVGAVVLAITLVRSPEPAPPVQAAPGATLQTAAPPSRGWAIGAGGLLAIGAAMIGLGMNRWNRSAA